ncbi:MAG: [FeFe] hydrogenase, group A, partial [Patescibacteria group bacterium]|nr:[FeFe] hydrogenase, group A [Patescibacteria group bacterium]
RITINNKKTKTLEGKTILEAAKEARIEIPTLCFHPDLKIKSNCRLCLVEIKGKVGLSTACSTKVEPGMEVVTDSNDIDRARRSNLELLLSEHCENCGECIWKQNCQLLKLSLKYKAKINRFNHRKANLPDFQFGPSVSFNSSKCIDCRNCVEACEKQNVGFLEVRLRNNFWQTLPTNNKKKDCVYCGQCVVHCPVGALEAAKEFEEVEKPILEKGKVVVVQFAPSIRASIGEEFGLPHGSIVTGQLAAAIRQLKVNKVFDVSVGADFTTIEEANELIERLKKRESLPMFTSCCPAWVKYVEFYHPELIPNLTTVRSPHIIMGGLIKTYWSKKEKIDPKKIVVVSIMPCTSKKYEIRRNELKINGLRPVDYVLTTRELAYLLTKHDIDLKNTLPGLADHPFGDPSGAGVIYGASGGVMESALRTAYQKITQEKLSKIEFEEVRGLAETKVASIKFSDQTLKVAVVNGLGNAEKILQELKRNHRKYDYVEVMACPGGCIGGGGQPVPTNNTIRQERAKALYKIDAKKEIRTANENPELKEVYQDFLFQDEIRKSICYTKFFLKKKEN